MCASQSSLIADMTAHVTSKGLPSLVAKRLVRQVDEVQQLCGDFIDSAKARADAQAASSLTAMCQPVNHVPLIASLLVERVGET